MGELQDKQKDLLKEGFIHVYTDDRKMVWFTDRQTYRQMDLQADKEANRMTDGLTGQIYCFTLCFWPMNRQAHRWANFSSLHTLPKTSPQRQLRIPLSFKGCLHIGTASDKTKNKKGFNLTKCDVQVQTSSVEEIIDCGQWCQTSREVWEACDVWQVLYVGLQLMSDHVHLGQLVLVLLQQRLKNGRQCNLKYSTGLGFVDITI